MGIEKCLLALAVLVAAVPSAHAQDAKPFAVVELFASEGCSSCPPADDLLSALVQEAQAKGLAIYPLSFQVDYWNDLGWIDPFSSPAFTERQRMYASVLRDHSVYTPEMVVNGRESFVGSDADKAKAAIAQALEQRPLNSITLQANVQSMAIIVHYHLGHAMPTHVLVLALVEDGVESRPNAGENAGAALRHDHLVRVLQTAYAPDGDITFTKPIGSGRLSIIAFLQDKHTLHIDAAAALAL